MALDYPNPLPYCPRSLVVKLITLIVAIVYGSAELLRTLQVT